MKSKKIFILLGHPDTNTLSSEMADTYEKSARDAGHEVRRTNLHDLSFDPILHKGYRERQNLEPDLIKIQEDMTWAEHFVLVYPLWWSGMPALLKGMWDRMFLPRFAYNFHKREHWYDLPGWDKLLKGRTARVITLSNTQPWMLRLFFGDFSCQITHAILGFAGFKARLTSIGNSEHLSEKTKSKWFKKVSMLGTSGC
jgi:NAD(P)H dehydrogenase (quinone)